MSFISELKRRNVVRVAVAYGVVSWLLLQVSDVLVDALDLPAAWTKALIAILLIGLVPVLVFSWVYEMTPEGLKRESEVPNDASVTAHTAKKLDLAVIVLLVLAISMFAVDRFLLPQQAPSEAVSTAQTIAQTSATTATTDTSTPVIAVLPLNALSSDQEGTFLASGLHDDLLTRLAKLQAFKVISRTSVMEYLGTTKNMRQIGRELGAGFIVEGGLQSIGGRVSINAQLIDASTDEHLWAETFNRELTAANLFDVQAEIAGAISQALHTTLSPSDLRTLETMPTQNLDAYRAYLRGLETGGELTQSSIYGPIEEFSRAVALDPNFSEAWAKLAEALIQRYWEEGGEDALAPDPALREQAGQALARAEALQPDSVSTLVAGGVFKYYGYRDYAGALINVGRAEASAPHDPDVIALRSYLLRRLGRLDESSDAMVQAMALNPNTGGMSNLIRNLTLTGRCDEALQWLERALREYPGSNGVMLTGAWTRLDCQGDMQAALAMISQVQITTLEEYVGVEAMLIDAHDYELAIERSLQALQATRQGGDQAAEFIIQSELAWLYRLAGKLALSEEALARAVAASEGLPRNAAILQQDALVKALQGNSTAAVELVGAALASLPEDAFIQPWSEYEAARIYAIAGVREEALAQLESLDAIARHEDRMRLTRDPAFDALRGEPRFEAVLPQ